MPWLVILIIAGFVLLVSEESAMGQAGKLSYDAVLLLAQNAGFSGDAAGVAAAIAMAESGGNPSAYNPETQAGAPANKGSYGLWQIYLEVHPEFENLNLYDPQVNANAAFEVYTGAGNSFEPWSTYKNNAYKVFLGG
jgi:hypothetical protein